jgi:DNA-binding LacI/PurR family transcriptional regulator
MATLRDVARLSGVSPATVSNVLHNRLRNTTPETRQRVLDAIRQLDYHPGAVPPGGPREAARTIGLVMWLAYNAPLTGYPYALSILDGILTVALANQWNLTILSVERWEDARAQVRLYADGRCDGFLIIAPSLDTISEALIERHYPFVVISCGDEDRRISNVGIDDVSAARELTSYVISKGHKRIAYLIGDDTMEDARQRIEGYKQALASAGLDALDKWIVRPGTYHLPDALHNLNAFLDRIASLPPAERPTALMCGNDQVAYNALQVLTQRGIRVPEDMSLAGFDGTNYAERANPSIATVRQPLFEIGARACTILLDRIGMGAKSSLTAPSEKVIFPHELIKGESVATLSS